MSNMWYLIVETVVDAMEDRNEPNVRKRPGSFSGERIGNAIVGRETVHDDLVDRGVRHALHNLVGGKVADQLFLGTVALLASLLFVHASGIFPWLGTSVFHNGPGTLLPDHHSEFGLNSFFAVKGQRLIIDYDRSIREGTGEKDVRIVTLLGGGLPQKRHFPLVVGEGEGRLSIPIEKTGFMRVESPKWGKARPDGRDALLDSASVKWGLMWRDPGGDYVTRTMGEIAAEQDARAAASAAASRGAPGIAEALAR